MAVQDTKIGQIYTHTINKEGHLQIPREISCFSDLSFLFGKSGEKFISRMELNEAHLLYEVSSMLNGDVLDIGTRHGGSALIILSSLREGEVQSVDISPDIHPEVHRAIKHLGLTDRVRFLVGNSRKGFENSCFAMIVFDGDHSVEGLFLDIAANWNSISNKSGFAAFHDVDLNGLKSEHYDPALSQTDYERAITPLVRELINLGVAKYYKGAGSLCVLKKVRDFSDASFETFRLSQVPNSETVEMPDFTSAAPVKTFSLKNSGEALAKIGLRASTLLGINGTLEIERDCSITSSSFSGECSIGTMTYLGPGCSVLNSIIGRYCAIAPNVILGSDGHPTDWIFNPSVSV